MAFPSEDMGESTVDIPSKDQIAEDLCEREKEKLATNRGLSLLELFADDPVCGETIRTGDIIEYYTPQVGVTGDPRALRQAMVLAVHPNDNSTKIVLSNSECIPNRIMIKRVGFMSSDSKYCIPYDGAWWSMDEYRLEEGGAATHADGVMIAAGDFSEIYNKYKDQLKAATEASGFQPMDVMVNLNGGHRVSQSQPIAVQQIRCTSDGKAVPLFAVDSEFGTAGDDEYSKGCNAIDGHAISSPSAVAKNSNTSLDNPLIHIPFNGLALPEKKQYNIQDEMEGCLDSDLSQNSTSPSIDRILKSNTDRQRYAFT